MTEASRFVDQVRQSLPRLKRGTPSFYGDRLDLPAGETRSVTEVDLDGDCVVLRFETGEILRIWDPAGYEVANNAFVVTRASRVVWEWYPDLQQQSPEARRFREYVARGSGIEARTNDDPYTVRLRPKVGYPAAEIC
ncbi:MAG: hypothetical protein ACYC6I_09685 [Bacillota bacterium]